MPPQRPKRQGVKLPKALQDELISLGNTTSLTWHVFTFIGQLQPRRAVKRRNPNRRPNGNSAESKAERKPVKKAEERRHNTGQPPRNEFRGIKVGKPLPKEEISDSSDDEGSMDEEDLGIAELEKKLGLDKKDSKKLDDGLDGLSW